MSCNTMVPSSLCRSWLLFTFIACMCSCAQQRTTESVPAVHPEPQSEIELKIEQARSNLAVSKTTEERIASEMNTLNQSGKATPERLKDYETYLSRVQAMVAENQKIVDEMEKAYLRHQGVEKAGGGSKSAPSAGTPAAAVAPGQENGDLGTLDRTLSDSLSEFDQMLLKEMDEIRAKSESRMSTLAQEAASAAGKIGEGDGEEGTEEGSPKSDQGESGGSYGNVPVTDGPVAGGAAGSGTVSDPGAQRPSGSEQDDDIVARQLREAAEKETDPELKKKLWKEYEEYKKAGR